VPASAAGDSRATDLIGRRASCRSKRALILERGLEPDNFHCRPVVCPWSALVMHQHDEDEHDSARERWYGKEIDRDQRRDVIRQKGAPHL
jgi:hypothetical protein